jgi:uncharacterized coiled-coil DUF342 family protein
MNGVGHQGSDERMQKNLSVRVDLLESTMADLNELPAQFKELSSQFLELRSDVRDEVSALRREVVGMQGELRGEMTEMRDELRDEMAAMHTDLAGAILSCERRVVTEMRVLHEAVLERIALIGEGRPNAGRRQKPPVPPAGRKRR